MNYSLIVPENDSVSTELSLEMDGETVPGSTLEIDKNTDSNSMVFSGQVIIQADDCARLSLVSSDSIDIEANNRSDTIATLVIHWI